MASVACAWYSMFPQLARGGCTPTPKKLSADSSRMPRATASVSETMTACAAFGSRCAPMIRACPAPAARAPSTKPRPRSVEELRPHHARRFHPAGQPDQHDQQRHRRLQHAGGDHQQRQPRHGQHRVGAAHQHARRSRRPRSRRRRRPRRPTRRPPRPTAGRRRARRARRTGRAPARRARDRRCRTSARPTAPRGVRRGRGDPADTAPAPARPARGEQHGEQQRRRGPPSATDRPPQARLGGSAVSTGIIAARRADRAARAPRPRRR